jgi:hypothetical protein
VGLSRTSLSEPPPRPVDPRPVDKVTSRPCRTTLAPILRSFSRSVVSDRCSTSVGDANFRSWPRSEIPATSTVGPLCPERRPSNTEVRFSAKYVRFIPSPRLLLGGERQLGPAASQARTAAIRPRYYFLPIKMVAPFAPVCSE